MQYLSLTNEELASKEVGEVLTLTTVMAVISVAIMAVVVYRLFRSKKGNMSAPGGWKFQWD